MASFWSAKVVPPEIPLIGTNTTPLIKHVLISTCCITEIKTILHCPPVYARRLRPKR